MRDDSITAILEDCASRIKELEHSNVENALQIGQHLERAFAACKRGEFVCWIEREFAWSYETACRYRRVARLAATCHCDSFVDLNISLSAVHLLAALDDVAVAQKVLDAARNQRVTRRIAEELAAEAEPPEAIESASEEPAGGAEKDAEPETAPSAVRSPPPTLRWLRQAVRLTDEQWKREVGEFGGPASVSALIRALDDKHRAIFGRDAVTAAADRAEGRSRRAA
ncbi:MULTISPECIES: hypothetical protein [unclassified Bradyrhizobium]|uniref:hypothetical protein n=1 Tax=unclassified Bradyrhizobium TaxID=2631580 RepID=UPI0028E2CB6D|nr:MULTISPECIES: hypothetical protein [unclassified Bradyrhizobium]